MTKKISKMLGEFEAKMWRC